MSLRKIKADIASEHGIQIKNEAEDIWLIDRINDAACEIYMSEDLPNSLKEQNFTFKDKQEVITLPWHVGEVRGIRRPCYNDQHPITLHDLRPRYHLNSWGDVSPDVWRIVGVKPTLINIESILPLTFKVPNPEPGNVTFTAQGMTAGGQLKQYEVVLAEGQTEVKMTNDIAEFNWITKDTVTINTVSIFSGTTLIGELVHVLDRTRYVALHVADNCYLPISGCPCGEVMIDVLYKPLYIPMYRDSDCFQIDGYEHNIVLKFGEMYTRDPAESGSYKSKLDNRANNQANDVQQGRVTKVNFGFNQTLQTYRAVTNPYYCDYNSIYGRD